MRRDELRNREAVNNKEVNKLVRHQAPASWDAGVFFVLCSVHQRCSRQCATRMDNKKVKPASCNPVEVHKFVDHKCVYQRTFFVLFWTFIRKPQWECRKFAPKIGRAFLRAFEGKNLQKWKKCCTFVVLLEKKNTTNLKNKKNHEKPTRIYL